MPGPDLRHLPFDFCWLLNVHIHVVFLLCWAVLGSLHELLPCWIFTAAKSVPHFTKDPLRFGKVPKPLVQGWSRNPDEEAQIGPPSKVLEEEVAL